MFEDKHGSYHAIPIHSGSIALRVKVENFGQHNLLPLLNVFGKLYYGTVNQHYFSQLFREKKQQFIEHLKKPTTATEKFSNFRLRMTRLALTTEWKWPACINMVGGTPEWATGNGRTLATGFTKNNPEQHLSVFFFDQVGTDIGQWLNDPIEVTTDQQLHTVLGTVYNSTHSPAIELFTVLKQAGERTCLFLHGVIDEELEGYQNSQEDTELILLNNLKQWQSRYPNPQLEIYTNWPNLITDSAKIWDYQVVGNTESLAHHMFHPGHLERLAKNEHESTKTRKHVLYVKNPRTIDLSEFLIWVDLEHTTFIDQNWDFILYRRDNNYKSQMISFSDN
jgi:hypothetical protein